MSMALSRRAARSSRRCPGRGASAGWSGGSSRARAPPLSGEVVVGVVVVGVVVVVVGVVVVGVVVVCVSVGVVSVVVGCVGTVVVTVFVVFWQSSAARSARLVAPSWRRWRSCGSVSL